MSLAAVQKKAVDLAISLNPTTVSVSRTEAIEKDGARESETSNVGSYTICLFSRASGRTANDVGGLKLGVDWTALADSESDFRWGANVSDTFTIENLGMFKVVSGTPVTADGAVAGYLLSLEVVS